MPTLPYPKRELRITNYELGIKKAKDQRLKAEGKMR
jgi:hypothetical protein